MAWYDQKSGDSRTKEHNRDNAVLTMQAFVFLCPQILSMRLVYGECLIRETKESCIDSNKLMYVLWSGILGQSMYMYVRLYKVIQVWILAFDHTIVVSAL